VDRGKTYIANTNVLDELRVNLRPLDNLDKELVEDAVERSVFQPALAALCQRRADSKRDDYIVGVL